MVSPNENQQQQSWQQTPSTSGTLNEEENIDAALLEVQRQSRMLAWQQQQQHTIGPSSSPSSSILQQQPQHQPFDLNATSSHLTSMSAPTMSEAKRYIAPTSGMYPPYHSMSPVNPSFPMTSYQPVTLQYSSSQPTYYQQQQQHHQEQPTPFSYSPQTQHMPTSQIPQSFPTSLPASWDDSFSSESFYPDAASSIPPQISPTVSPHERSRPYPLTRQSPSTASPPKSSGSGSGTMMGMPLQPEEGARWATSSGQRSGHLSGSVVYPSGLVYPHRGSYSTLSSGEDNSRSSSLSMPLGSHHFTSNPGNVISSPTFYDASGSAISLPPPNPPPEIQSPMEPETQRRAVTACNFCRARKLRCDGNAPCRQCARRHLECVFTQPNPARRRKKQDDDGGDDDSKARKDTTLDGRRTGTHSGAGRRRSSTNLEIRTSVVNQRPGQQEELGESLPQSHTQLLNLQTNLESVLEEAVSCTPPEQQQIKNNWTSDKLLFGTDLVSSVVPFPSTVGVAADSWLRLVSI